MSANDRFVVKHPHGWAVKKAGAERASGVYDTQADAERAAKEYGCTPEAIAASPVRIAEILNMQVKRLKGQQGLGSPYLVGRSLTAADIYWACFSVLVSPFPADVNPMPDWVRALFEVSPPEIRDAKDPILFAHRDMIYAKHLKLPLDF